jgi:hypothetical protein
MVSGELERRTAAGQEHMSKRRKDDGGAAGTAAEEAEGQGQEDQVGPWARPCERDYRKSSTRKEELNMSTNRNSISILTFCFWEYVSIMTETALLHYCNMKKKNKYKKSVPEYNKTLSKLS